MTDFAASQLVTGGRKFFAEIVDASDQTKDWPARENLPARTVTQLQLSYKRPDGVIEYEWYNLPDTGKGVNAGSDLGKLIQHFNKLGISDIGLDSYKPIRGIFVEVECFPKRNRKSGDDGDKKFPIRILTADDIATEFGSGAVPPAAVDMNSLYVEILPDVLGVVDGIAEKDVFPKLAAVPAIAGHSQAATIFAETRSGKLLQWLTDNGHATVDGDGNISVVAAATTA